MATGSYQHFGFTLISTAKDAGVTNELPPESDASEDPAAAPGVFDGLNRKLGKPLFNAFSRETMARPTGTVIKTIDAYAEGFLSSAGGFAVMGDLGLDMLKVESPKFDLGLGFRMDTGINVGSHGGRLCFFGFGGEIVLGDEEEEKKEDTNADAATSASLADRITGIGFQFWVIKGKVMVK